MPYPNSRLSTQVNEDQFDENLSSPQQPQLTDVKPKKLTDSSDEDWSYATKELLDALPRIWTRGLLYFLVVFVVIALPWATFSRVDETGVARGRLEPKGKTIKLDAPVAGTVAMVNVKEGDWVKTGQILLELQSDLVNAELQQQQRKLTGQSVRLNQLDLLKNQVIIAIRTQELQNQAQELEKQSQIDQAQQNLKALKMSYYLQKEEKQAQVNQAQQDLAKNKIAYNLANISLEGAQEKYQRYREAFQQGVISQDRFQETEQLIKENSQRRGQAQSDIAQAKARLAEQQSSYQRTIGQVQADIAQAQLRLQEQERSYQTLTHSGKLALLKSQEQLKNLETEMITLKAEIAQGESQIASLKFQLTQRTLKAPMEGIVFQLPTKNAGDVVQPGDLMAEIAPQGTSLSLRGEIATSESGSLRLGMPVKIKFDAYPFQDYGIAEGKVMEISPTSKETETAQGKITTYQLNIELDRNCLPKAKECLPLRPGDTATAEVIVRQRRVIDFILDPFKQLQQGN